MRNALFLLATLILSMANAQTWTVRTGADLYGENGLEGEAYDFGAIDDLLYGARISPTVHLGYSMPFRPKLDLGAELTYFRREVPSQLHFVLRDRTFSDGQTIYARATSTRAATDLDRPAYPFAAISYVGLSLLPQYVLAANERATWRVYLGPRLDYLVNAATTEVDPVGLDAFTRDLFEAEEPGSRIEDWIQVPYARWSVHAVGGLGYARHLNQQWSVVGNLRGSIGVTNLYDKGYALAYRAPVRNRWRALSADLGVSYTLK